MKPHTGHYSSMLQQSISKITDVTGNAASSTKAPANHL